MEDLGQWKSSGAVLPVSQEGPALLSFGEALMEVEAASAMLVQEDNATVG